MTDRRLQRLVTVLAFLVCAFGAQAAAAGDPAAAERTARISVTVLSGPLLIAAGPLIPLQPSAVGPRAATPFLVETLVDDLTSSGDGWHVVATIAGGSSSQRTAVARLTSVEQHLLAGRPAVPSSAAIYPLTLYDGVPARVYNAATGSGMGRMTLVLRGELLGGLSPDLDRRSVGFTIAAGP